MIERRTSPPARALGVRRDARSTSTARRRPSRSSRSPTATSACAATSTRASRAALSGTYLNGFYESLPARVRRARLRLRRGRPGGRQRAPTARSSGCWSRTSRSTSTAARLEHARAARSTSAPACSSATLHWTLARPADAVTRRDASGSSRSTQRSVAAIQYEVEARRPAGARSRSSRTCMANQPRGRASTTTRARPPISATCSTRELLRPRRAARGARAHDAAHRSSRSPPGMDHVDRVRRPTSTSLTQSEDDLGRVTLVGRARARQAAAADQVPRLPLVLAADRSSGCATRSTRASRSRSPRASTGSSRAQRDVPRRLLGRAPTSSSTATPSSSRRCASRCSTLLPGRRPAPRAARSPAKGLTGTGYDGHAFWDTETFVLPSSPTPRRRRSATRCTWRHSTLEQARERAEQLGLRGAAFPWRTIHGEECSGYWPAGTAAFHVNADIADAVRRYVLATGDEEFERELRARAAGRDRAAVGEPRPPRRRRALPDRRRDRARRVLGAGRQQRLHEPDGAAEPARRPPSATERHPGRRERARGRRRARSTAWRRAADAMFVPFDEQPRHPPAGPGLPRPHAAGTSRTRRTSDYPLLLHHPYFAALPQAGDQAGRPRAGAVSCAATPSPPSEKRAQLRLLRGADRARLVAVGVRPRRSIAAEVGHLDLAHDYLAEAAHMDLARPRAQHRRRPAHGVARRARVIATRRRLRRAARAATASSSSTRACPRGSTGSPTRSSCAARCCASRSTAARRPTASSAAAAST